MSDYYMYDVEELEDYFQPLIKRIESLFNRTVVIDDYDDEWVQFHVAGLVDRSVIVALEKHNKEILAGNEQKKLQILCAWNPSDGDGLWLHYLKDPIARIDYRAGVWFS